MEVRLSDFAEIVGTTTATIRSAIQTNKLPFMDTQRADPETTGKMARRTYSVADAFGWFLQDTAGRGLPMGQWAMSGIIQSAWPRGLSWYVKDRLAGRHASEVYLIKAAGLPSAEGIITDRLEWAVHEIVGDRNVVEDVRNRYPLVTTVQLNPIFDLFEQVVRARGWRIDEEGFHRMADPIEGRQEAPGA